MDRIFYNIKIHKSFKDIKQVIDIKSIDFIYAHTIFADGRIAYYLNKKYGIKYVVVVRNSDINGYLKYIPFAKRYLQKVIKNAKKVIFISQAMEKDLKNKIKDKEFINELENKSVIIPNGINEYWHNSTKEIKKSPKNELKLIQVSTLDKNKNLYASMFLIKELIKIGYNASLTIVGNGEYEKKYKKYANKLGIKEKIVFVGYIKDKEKLSRLYKEHDIFVMLSKTETFGLVYIEAMSQGLPIIYSKNTGIDGYFEEQQIGFSMNPYTMKENVKDNIERILKNYEEISTKNIGISSEFKWKKISDRYLELMEK